MVEIDNIEKLIFSAIDELWVALRAISDEAETMRLVEIMACLTSAVVVLRKQSE